MTAETITVDPELARAALSDVLDDDAARTPAAAPPPRRQIAGATPEAPWGYKDDGTPRKGPPGPGRPRKDPAAAARVEAPTPTPEPAGGTLAKASYAEEVNDALTLGWMILASLPPTQAPAYVLHEGIPAMVPAWDKAAQKNATVRSYVLKLSGEGSWAWALPVIFSTMPVLMGMWQVMVIGAEERAKIAAATRKQLQEFVLEQARAAGIQVPEDSSSASAGPDQTESPPSSAAA